MMQIPIPTQLWRHVRRDVPERDPLVTELNERAASALFANVSKILSDKIEPVTFIPAGVGSTDDRWPRRVHNRCRRPVAQLG